MSLLQHVQAAQESLEKMDCLSDKLRHLFRKVAEALKSLHLEDTDRSLIQKALENIANGPKRPLDKNERVFYANTVHDTCNAICIFGRALKNCRTEAIREIEQKLFRVVFTPCEGGAQVYPVYSIHDALLNTKHPFSNLKSSTGSGKTRCAPFFFALRALHERLERPFFIMTQPGSAIIRDKIRDFQEILGKSVHLVTGVHAMERLYQGPVKKPVVCILTPYNVVKLLVRADEKHRFPLVSRARFALDEIHERSVEADVLVALLAEKMVVNSFPLQLLMMSATPDPRVLKIFGSVDSLKLPDSQLFPIKDYKVESPDFHSLDRIACDNVIEVIKQMANSRIDPGHILIFTSRNK